MCPQPVQSLLSKAIQPNPPRPTPLPIKSNPICSTNSPQLMSRSTTHHVPKHSSDIGSSSKPKTRQPRVSAHPHSPPPHHLPSLPLPHPTYYSPTMKHSPSFPKTHSPLVPDPFTVPFPPATPPQAPHGRDPVCPQYPTQTGPVAGQKAQWPGQPEGERHSQIGWAEGAGGGEESWRGESGWRGEVWVR